MKRILLLAVVGLLILFGVWIWRTCFPGDEAKIRRLLAEVADTASLKPDENPLVRLAAAGKLAGFFTLDVVINIDVAGLNEKTIQGRDELQQVAAASRASLQSAEIRFPDAQLNIEPDHISASADVAAIADVNGEKNAVVQELKFGLKKIDGKWRISQVDTIKTLRR